MNGLGRYLALLSLVLLVAAHDVQRAGAEGIGIYPGDIKYMNVLRGGQYFQDVGVVNDSKVERVFRLEAGGDIAAWVGFFDIRDRAKQVTEISIPASSDGHVFMRLLVPPDLANGRYGGYVRTLATIPSNIEGSTLTVTVGAQASVDVIVTGTQNLAGNLVDLGATDTEVGTPLRLRTVVLNSGNVVVQPEIYFDVRPVAAAPGSSTSVPSLATVPGPRRVTANEPVFPGETKTLITEIPTDTLAPATYRADIAVRFGSFTFGSRNLNVTVHPRGALTRQGELLELRLVNEPQPGGLAKVQATFINTGQIDSKAAFVGELYHQGELVNAITGLEKVVSKGEQAALDLLVEVPVRGEYRLVGKVSFEGRETDSRELVISVGVPSEAGIGPWPFIGGAAAVLALLLAGGGFWLRARAARARA
jgi:hypothetical protein